MTLDLTAAEIKVLLWHIALVEKTFGNGGEAPDRATVASAKRKLMEEVAR